MAVFLCPPQKILSLIFAVFFCPCQVAVVWISIKKKGTAFFDLTDSLKTALFLSEKGAAAAEKLFLGV
jgi:hypothetical protein